LLRYSADSGETNMCQQPHPSKAKGAAPGICGMTEVMP
jgi:hypothetical protein